MPTTTLNGATYHYEDTGAPAAHPNAATIVFGHGLLFSGWMFHHQVDALKDRYRCVTIDWRGQGETPAAPGGYDMDTLADDVEALIDSLGVGPVHYVGLSMGGFIGQRLAARHGELVRSLTLLDTSADPEPTKSRIEDKILAVAYRFLGMNALLRSQVSPIMFGPTFRNDPAGKATIDEFYARLARCDRSGMRRAVLGVADRAAIYPEIGRIGVPTLVVVGADDVPTPVAKAKRIAERIPGARLEIVPDSGHSSTVEQPEAITALIEAFLTDLP